MPRPKRSIEELANKSDSDDDDYSDHPTRRSRKTPAHSRKKKSGPVKKRRRPNDSDDDDIVSDDESLNESEDLSDFMEAEDEAEINASGRRTRKAAQNRPFYNVDTSDGVEDEEDEENDEEEVAEEEDEADQYELPRPRTRSQLLTLKLRPEVLRQVSLSTNKPSRRTRGSSQRGTQSPDGSPAKYPRRGSRHTRASSKLADVEEDDVAMKQNDDERFNETTMGIQGSQLEVLESDPQGEDGDQTNEQLEEEGFVPESENGDAKDENAKANEADNEEEDEDDEGPVTRRRSRPSRNEPTEDEPQPDAEEEAPRTRRSGRKKPPKSSQRKQDEESDFEPEEEESNDEDEMSQSEAAGGASRKGSQAREVEDDSAGPRRSGLRRRPPRSGAQSETGGDIAEELAEELEDLKGSRSRRRLQPEIVYEKPRRSRKDVDYRIIRPDILLANEELENEITESPSRRGRGGGGGWQRTLFPTYGPFGGGGPSAILGPPGAPGATGGVDSDSSDDEVMQHPKNAGASSALPGTGHLSAAQTHGADVAQGLSGTPANLGKVKDKQTLADADPLGVDTNVSFDGVGGLQGHIDQLKEMVSLPLLYPEIFQRFHIVPPRGVLFHGPPGTGKTLLARALANSVSSEGRKVTFYMRKGADALSKWVGEAERQLRLLFDEARKTQPSIIFFDEIDGK